MIQDLNKGINTITYNYMNLPEQITVEDEGTIKFLYDAGGDKLQKIVTDQTVSPAKTTTTDYIDGFEYQQDTLQFFPTEDGRVRYVPAHSTTPASYVYDYFIKDHLGNVRVVLTEQTDFSQYMATMERANDQKEEALFSNISSTREAKPADYPEDDVTSPNTAVARLNGKDPDRRIGPSIILKVMAGDTIEAGVHAFYGKKVTQTNNPGIPAADMLADLLATLAAPAATGLSHQAMSAARANPPINLTTADLSQLKSKAPDMSNQDKPKAYLNYVFFDNRFNFVSDGSGVKQVNGDPGQLETLASGQVVAKKDGYVYVCTSNESQQDVLFDNMSVMQITGPVLEETHYYPFGLTMAGISTVAPLKLEGRRKFNGIEFNHKEFSDGRGLELYTAQFRGLDPQIGRWWQVDPNPDYDQSPYSAMSLDPVLKSDFMGDTVRGDLKAKKAYVDAMTQGINGGLNKIGKLLKKSLCASGGKLKRLNGRIARTQQKLKGFVAARNEFNTLESSTQNYNIVTGVTDLSSNEDGMTVYNSNTGNVDLKISATAPNPIGTLAHELKHAYQYETNEVSLLYNGLGGGPLDDLHDELAAFRRGQLFGDNTSVDFTIPLLQKMYKDPAGPINVNSPYSSNQSYGDAINDQLFLLGETGKRPIVIINGWQQSYLSGVMSNFLP